jgi:hypothetical protein
MRREIGRERRRSRRLLAELVGSRRVMVTELGGVKDGDVSNGVYNGDVSNGGLKNSVFRSIDIELEE